MEEARSKSILTGPACCKSVGMGRVTPGCLHLAGNSGTLLGREDTKCRTCLAISMNSLLCTNEETARHLVFTRGVPAKNKKQRSNNSRPQRKPWPIKFAGLNSPSASFSEQLANDRAIQQHLRRLNQNRGLYFARNAGGSEAKDIVGFNAPLFEG